MQVQTHVDINSEWGIVAARQAGRKLAREIGFGSVDQARITTAISELARNIYLYANKGQIQIEEVAASGKRGIKIIADDQGPGIKDLRRVMEDGFTTSGGLGAGLPGVRRLMDEFSIDSELDQGTTITATKWLR
ncbi:anti-sigma regulatory factor [Paenalkalicoccus suaedae]|uniref:Anti-sigma regulatory factor n=1 Tax=Paenalkalicoccus suaedae TaxID=2592382 RepID=A0A859FCA3_9BACI|nr:anti-sigma regulatory factor [Paenalkalicoccus suaedae]QKS70194.1 anti-sigma regulatory factor [Paenalkalicoccus suaedae]